MVFNHISEVDPLIAAHVLCDHGRLPRYLAKAGLFKNKFLGFFLRSAGQIPVERLSKNAAGAFDAAVAAVRAGECVVVYPEGTITRDPDLWPMVGKSGAARIALETRAPVIPIGQWGAQELLAPYARKPDLFPRKRITMKVGDPVDLSDLAAQEHTPAVGHRGDRPDHGRAHRPGRGSARRDRAGRERSTRARPVSPRSATPTRVGARSKACMSKVAVFGAGSWGTAFSIVLADGGNDVTMWARREEVVAAINDGRENVEYLPGIELPPAIAATHDVEKAAHGADIVIFATPSQSFRDNLEEWTPYLADDAVLVSLMKGVELGTLNRMSEVIAQVTGAGPERIGVISGPNLAKEIARREPAASVVACADEDVARMLQDRCHSPAFRPYTSVDVLGCELGGAYKNVVGLAVGMAVGLGFGDNTTASVITRGLAETARLAMKLGANPLTLMGLAGPRRPRRHLLLAAVAQPHVRREARPGHDLRGDLRLHPPGRRGRQVLRLAACPRRAQRRRRPGRAVRRRRRRRPDDRAGHDGRDPRARPRASQLCCETEHPTTGWSRTAAEPRDATGWTHPRVQRLRRSAQRSSTSSMPTDSRTRPSGMVAGSDFQRRRRSKVDSTPPRLVAWTHSAVARTSRSARSAVGSTIETMPPRPG